MENMDQLMENVFNNLICRRLLIDGKVCTAWMGGAQNMLTENERAELESEKVPRYREILAEARRLLLIHDP